MQYLSCASLVPHTVPDIKLIVSQQRPITPLGHSAADSVSPLVIQKVPSELHPKVRNHGEGPF